MFPQSANKIKDQIAEFVMQGLDVCSVCNVLYTSHTSPCVMSFKNVFYFHLLLCQIRPSIHPLLPLNPQTKHCRASRLFGKSWNPEQPQPSEQGFGLWRRHRAHVHHLSRCREQWTPAFIFHFVTIGMIFKNPVVTVQWSCWRCILYAWHLYWYCDTTPLGIKQ